MSNLKFSILIPTKNGINLLSHTITSIINQTYDNWEIIISDNCSEENIGDYIETIDLKGKIIYYRQNEPVSVTENWNTANNLATGDYIIMLGDDDALLPTSLSILEYEIKRFDYPDAVIYPAYLYLSPNVDPKNMNGSVEITQEIINCKHTSHIDSDVRMGLVKKCFEFDYKFGFNMQYYCYSNKIVKKIEKYGNFYEPPYPDYYTSCMIMLLSETIIQIPKKLSIIGVTPKSYGYYFRNNIEKEGLKYHNESNYRENSPISVRDKLCSVCEMYTAALATFALIPERLPNHNLQINIDNYYKIVLMTIIENKGIKEAMNIFLNEICPNINLRSKLKLLLIMPLKYTKTTLITHYKSRRKTITNNNNRSYSNIEQVITAIINGEI